LCLLFVFVAPSIYFILANLNLTRFCEGAGLAVEPGYTIQYVSDKTGKESFMLRLTRHGRRNPILIARWLAGRPCCVIVKTSHGIKIVCFGCPRSLSGHQSVELSATCYPLVLFHAPIKLESLCSIYINNIQPQFGAASCACDQLLVHRFGFLENRVVSVAIVKKQAHCPGLPEDLHGNAP
jgi:hypothetical protein